MTRRTGKLSAWFSVAAALVASGAWSASAQEPAASDVSVEVLLIYGSADEGKIDAELTATHDYLKSILPMRFGTLQRFDSKRVELMLGQLGGVALPSGAEVRFLPIAIVDGRLHMHLEMPGMNTRLQIPSGRTLILGGPRYENGLVIVELRPTFAVPAGTPGAPVPDEGPETTPRPPASRVVQQPNSLPSSAPPVRRVGAER
jgi:hypothetical protein